MFDMSAEHISLVLPAALRAHLAAAVPPDRQGVIFVALIGGFALVILAMIGLSLAAAARRRRAAQQEVARRSAALREWAVGHGWQYHDGELRATWRDRLAAGNGEFIVHRLVHRDLPGGPVTVASCSYRVRFTPVVPGPGESYRPGPVRAHLTVALLSLTGHRRPDIYVRRFEPLLGPQGWLPERYDEVPAAHLVRPVPSGHPEFDARVRVGSPDPAAARGPLTPAVMDAHLRRELDTWALCGDELTLVQEAELRPETVEPAVRRIHRLAQLLTQSG